MIPRIILSRRLQHREAGAPQLVLIIYNTLKVNFARSNSKPGIISLPGKYALCWYDGSPNEDRLAAVLADEEGCWDQAEWFNKWSDIPVALERLRECHPDIPLSVQISEVMDW